MSNTVPGYLLLVCLLCTQLSVGQSLPAKPTDRSAMTRAFAEGSLPPPLHLPSTDRDALAQLLARKISQGQAEAVPALETALLLAGFGIRNQGVDGSDSLLMAKASSQGIVFDAWEVATMAMNYAQRKRCGLRQLSSGLVEALPPLRSAPVSAALIASIREGSQSSRPPVRFFSRFLIELGKVSEFPYDLLSNSLRIKEISFDGIQTPLLLVRFIGDLSVLPNKRASLVPQHAFPRPLFQLVNASFTAGTLEYVREESGPCNGNSNQNFVIDATTNAASITFGKLWASLASEEIKETIERAGLALSSLTAAMKMLNALSTIKVDIQMSGGEPFIRTVDASPGQTRLLTAAVFVDPGKWAPTNCFRFPLAMLGGTVKALPKRPLHTGVEWREGGVRSANGLLEHLVYFTALPGQPRSPVTVTDEEGVSKMQITGRPNYTKLEPSRLHPVMKTLTILVDVQPSHFFPEDEESRRDEVLDVATLVVKALVAPPDAVIDAVTDSFMKSYLPGGRKDIRFQDWGTHFLCGPTGQVYDTASECTHTCHASLANFVGICVPH